jgi:hypothetical protein
MKRILFVSCLLLLFAGALFAQTNGWHIPRPITSETNWNAGNAYLASEGMNLYLVYVSVEPGTYYAHWYFRYSTNNGVLWSDPISLFTKLGTQYAGGDYNPRAGIVKSATGIHIVANIMVNGGPVPTKVGITARFRPCLRVMG